MVKKRTILVVAIVLLLVNLASFFTVFFSTTYFSTIDKTTGAASTTTTGRAAICIVKPPTITAIDAQTATLAIEYTLQVEAAFHGPNTSISYFDNTSLFNINGSGYANFTPTGADLGTYSILITVQDASDCNIAVNSTAAFSLTVQTPAAEEAAGPGAGGGAGGGGAPPTKKTEIKLSVEPQEVELDKLRDIVFSWAGEIHTISLVRVEGKSVTLLIKTNPQFITLDLGEEESVDLDDDRRKDISISLSALAGETAKLKIRIIREGILLSDDVLKVSIRQSQLLERKITVVHDWMENLEIELRNSLENLLAVDPANFLLLVNSKQPVVLSFNPQRDAALGTHMGTITVTPLGPEILTKIITLVAEVESDAVLLDGSLDLREKTVRAGEELHAAVSVFNFLDVPVQNVTLVYEIFDSANAVKYQQEEYINIEKQASFTKIIPVPKDLPPGQYVLSLKMIYGDSFATATEIFTVEEKVKAPLVGLAALAGGRTFLYALPVMFLLIVGIAIALLFTHHKIKKAKIPKVIKERTVIKQKTIIKPKIIIRRDVSEYKRKLAIVKEGYSKGYLKEETYQRLKAKLEELIRKGG